MAEEEGAEVKSTDDWGPRRGTVMLKDEVRTLTLERCLVLYILSRK